MKQLLTAKDVQDLLARKGLAGIPAGAMLTPSAKDLVNDARRQAGTSGKASPASAANPEPIVPDYEYKWVPGTDPRTPQEIASFFASPEIRVLCERIANIGRRIWEKDYVDGNGGNITVRVGDNLVLCTPTLISKGFMTPEDICLVDFDGKQLAGTRKRTSEVMTHLGIMRRQPKAKSCVHAHPPHATAFAVASVVPPTCMIPEAEVFLGRIGMAPYRTPGSPENADIVGQVGVDHQSVLMENHGVITWGKDVEDAYWKMENTDSYCKTVWIASQLGAPLKTISGAQAKELIGIRKQLGMDDYRENWKECELCDNSDFRPGVVCAVPPHAAPAAAGNTAPQFNADAEELVREITNRILAAQQKG